jgi:hypothetical protein
MNRSKALSLFPALAALSLAACSGPKGPCTLNCGGGGGGNGSAAVTMVVDKLPAHPGLLTFEVTISSITFTPASGTATTVNLNPGLSVDLMRLQSDSVFLGTFANIPAASYSSVTLTLTGNANITFLNDTGATLSGCPGSATTSTICPLTVAASSNPVATLSFTVSQNVMTGIGIDLSLINAVSISGGNLVVNFSNNNVLSAFTLPRQTSTLAAGQLDLFEDFTGVVSISNQTVTLASAAATGRGSLAATANSSTIFNSDPSQKLCLTPTSGQVSSCVSNNQFASMDVILKSDGTLAVQEIEPLLPTLQDTVEGIVVSVKAASATQFTIIVTDLIPSATNSLISTLHIGDGLTVNLSGTVQPFLVDTKDLPVQNNFNGVFIDFFGKSDTSAIHLGQSVSVHVIAPFTAAAGATLASATTDTVTLRWTRFTATTSTNGTPAFSITGFPSFFNATGVAQVQSFSTTNMDGVSSTSGLVVSNPVAMRALFIENTSNSANPAFFAAKVRQH